MMPSLPVSQHPLILMLGLQRYAVQPLPLHAQLVGHLGKGEVIAGLLGGGHRWRGWKILLLLLLLAHSCGRCCSLLVSTALTG